MNAILSIFPVGTLSLIFLFCACFLIIHIIKLIKIGWLAQGKMENNEKKEEEKAPAPKPAQEPVYYIVERKRRAKSSFSEPKRIHFK